MAGASSSAPAECSVQRAGPLYGASAEMVPVRKYDVFINHRGPDVKRGFVSHLVDRLKAVNFSCFVDYEGIQIGDLAREVIKSAIQHSKIHIAIFSPGYVESAWCLDELLSIMECFRNKSTELFMAVFFNVTPSDLRSPMLSKESCYNKSFDGHAEKFYATTVSGWKMALHDAADVKGYIFPGDFQGFEAKLVGSIVSRVIEVLSQSTLLHGPEHPVGLDEKLWKALTCMERGIWTKGIQMFGIYGMGGLGKTTLAKSIYNRIHREFESTCFLQNVSERCKIRGFEGLQEDLLQELLKTHKISITNTARGKKMMQERLEGKKVLIIMDNVSEKQQLDELIPPNYDCCLGKGSLIVITTRDQQVLDLAQVKRRLEMEGLSKELALELFLSHAFPSTRKSSTTNPKQLQTKILSNIGFKKLAEKVADACQGLPLALEVLGSHLRDKDISKWEATETLLARNKLGNPMSRVTKSLKISFDELCFAEKDMFLDVACFLFQEPNDKAMLIWGSDFGDAEAEQYLDNLMHKCLVKLDKNGDLIMHDLLRDMGRQIVDSSHKDYWKRSHLWRKEEVERVLKKGSGTSHLRGLSLCVEKEWDTESFTGMDELKLLVLNRVTLTGDFRRMPQELRWFQWRNCPLNWIPLSLHLDKVAVLDLEGSLLTRFSCADCELQNLRELNLNNCSNLVELLIDFSKSSKSLEVLTLSGCVNLERIPVSICELGSSLRYLDVSQCGKLTSLPAAIGNLTALSKIGLDGVGLSTLPESFGSLSSLVSLRLHHSSNLRYLPITIGNLVNLVHFHISDCDAIFYLPESVFGRLTRLEELHLCDMVRLISLPRSLCSLRALKVLNLQGCSNLCKLGWNDLPSSLAWLAVGGCTSLKYLSLFVCNSLEAVPSGLESLSKLSYLDFSGCRRCLPLSVGGLKKLTSLKTLNLSGSLMYLELTDEDENSWIEAMVSLEEVVLSDHYFLRHCKIEDFEMMGFMGRSLETVVPESMVTVVPESFDVNACSGVVSSFVYVASYPAYVHGSYHSLTLEVVGNDEDDVKFSQALRPSQFQGMHQHVTIYRAMHPLVASLRGGNTIQVRHTHGLFVIGYVKLMYGEREMQETLQDLSRQLLANTEDYYLLKVLARLESCKDLVLMAPGLKRMIARVKERLTKEELKIDV